MNNITTMAVQEPADAELVARTMAGDRDAFGQIVARHQTLICSVAYNATGDLSQSEDLAQEIFIAAWRELRQLREPAKLRAWLCGIARNIIHNRFRRLKREPVHGAADLAAVADVPAVEPLPSEQVVTREREAILWNALARIPELYREPLILFYRQHKSVERVAADLELSEEVVKQRLSRGRKLLHEQVIAFVEGALEHTAPGVMFTTTVLGSLPLLVSSGMASAAGAGGMVAKSGGAALAAKILTTFNVVIGPLLGVFAGVVSVIASFKAVRTPRERAYMKRYYKILLVGIGVYILATAGLLVLVKTHLLSKSVFTVVSVGSSLVYSLLVLIFGLRMKRTLRLMRQEDQRLHPELFDKTVEGPCGSFVEYRSRHSFLGLPLVHLRVGTPVNEKMKPAIGWIAVGDCAIGLVALGGLAFGGLCIGGVAIGLAAIGGVSVGGLASGGMAIGAIANGGIAMGLVAMGADAYGWVAAQGIHATAYDFALGKHATATHANDAVARAWFAAHEWFDFRTHWGKALMSLVWLPPVLLLIRYRRTWLPKRHT